MQATRPEPTDEALVERFRGGDRSAFDEIVSRHRRAVYGVARRLLKSHEDADEAAQVAFVRAWRALDGFRGEAALATWLTRIVLNVAKSMRMSARPTEEPESWDRIPDAGASSEESVSREQSRQRVRRAVGVLPPRQQEVVLLKVFSEMTHKEVAETLELSVGTVKAHLHQAVSNLRRTLARKPAAGRESR